MKCFCIWAITAVISFSAYSQSDFDRYSREQKNDFENYKKERQSDFLSYRKKRNAEFADYLAKRWEYFDVVAGRKKPLRTAGSYREESERADFSCASARRADRGDTACRTAETGRLSGSSPSAGTTAGGGRVLRYALHHTVCRLTRIRTPRLEGRTDRKSLETNFFR